MTLIPKDPQAFLDYKWDWDQWLEEGEEITDFDFTIPAALTLDADNSGITDGGRSVTAWISGGTAIAENTVSCKITTNSTPPRIDVRSMVLRITRR